MGTTMNNSPFNDVRSCSIHGLPRSVAWLACPPCVSWGSCACRVPRRGCWVALAAGPERTFHCHEMVLMSQRAPMSWKRRGRDISVVAAVAGRLCAVFRILPLALAVVVRTKCGLLHFTSTSLLSWDTAAHYDRLIQPVRKHEPKAKEFYTGSLAVF